MPLLKYALGKRGVSLLDHPRHQIRRVQVQIVTRPVIPAGCHRVGLSNRGLVEQPHIDSSLWVMSTTAEVDKGRTGVMLRLSIGVLLIAVALSGCFSQPNSGILGGSVIGLVSSADGTCVNAGPNLFNGERDEPTCFAGRVGHRGQCVRVSTNTAAVNGGPPLRFRVISIATMPKSRCG